MLFLNKIENRCHKRSLNLHSNDESSFAGEERVIESRRRSFQKLSECSQSLFDLLKENLISQKRLGRLCSKIFKVHLLTGRKHDDLTRKYLSDDIYSLIFVCKNWSKVMIFCIGAITFQLGILLVLMSSLTEGKISDENESNPFKLPPDVDIVVRISQLFAIIISITSQEGFIYGLSFFYDGYSEDIMKYAPHATKTKFYIAGSLKFLEGLLSLLVSFILVMRNDSVIQLFSDFASLEFIFSINSVLFYLAGNYFFIDELAILVGQINNMKVPAPNCIPTPDNLISSYRLLSLSHVFAIMMISWMLLSIHQREGKYACNSILAQFGDEAVPVLTMYSGMYDRIKGIGSTRYQINNRFVYVRRDYHDAMFAYCQKENAWTLTFDYAKTGKTYMDLDPCDYVAKSKETETYDITQTVNTEWITFNTVTSQNAQVDFISLSCKSCTDCNGNGICTDKGCLCQPGTYGFDCELKNENICKNITQGLNHLPFVTNVTTPFSLFTSSNSFRSYGRPIFYRNITDDFRVFDFIIFLGGRWGYFRINNTSNVNERNADLIIRIIADSFATVNDFSKLSIEQYPVYLSSNVKFGVSSDTGMPTSLFWYEVIKSSIYVYPDKNKMVDVRLQCSICGEFFNPCQNAGICNNSSCVCPSNYKGDLCEAKTGT